MSNESYENSPIAGFRRNRLRRRHLVGVQLALARETSGVRKERTRAAPWHRQQTGLTVVQDEKLLPMAVATQPAPPVTKR
jgi:hypothetical protein